MSEIMLKESIEENKIFLERKINSVSELLDTGWADSIALFGKIELTEEICFDFKNGQTQAVLKDKNGESICSKNLFYSLKGAENSFTGRAIKEDTELGERLRELFERTLNISFPWEELTISRIIEAVRFQGFESSFYRAIPYEKEECTLDKSFEELSEKITDTASVMKLIENSDIPLTKTIIKLFSEKQKGV